MRSAFEASGEIRSVDLLASFVTLWRERASGTLSFTREGAHAAFDIAAGEVARVSSSEPHFETTAILVRAGKLDPGAIARVVVPEGSDPGAVAVQAGLATRKDWRWGQKIRAIEVLSDLLGWIEGQYGFDRDARPDRGEFPVPIPRLVLELFLRSRDRALVERALGPSDVPLVRVENFDGEFGSFGLTADAGNVVALIDGKATAAEISERAPADEFAVLKLLAALATLGLVHSADAAPAAPDTGAAMAPEEPVSEEIEEEEPAEEAAGTEEVEEEEVGEEAIEEEQVEEVEVSIEEEPPPAEPEPEPETPVAPPVSPTPPPPAMPAPPEPTPPALAFDVAPEVLETIPLPPPPSPVEETSPRGEDRMSASPPEIPPPPPVSPSQDDAGGSTPPPRRGLGGLLATLLILLAVAVGSLLLLRSRGGGGGGGGRRESAPPAAEPTKEVLVFPQAETAVPLPPRRREPSVTPTAAPPTRRATATPTLRPTAIPTAVPPTRRPTATPTLRPTAVPTPVPPTRRPSPVPPTRRPAPIPPTSRPTAIPPTRRPSPTSTAVPTRAVPTRRPTAVPTPIPPTAVRPTRRPAVSPTALPAARAATPAVVGPLLSREDWIRRAERDRARFAKGRGGRYAIQLELACELPTLADAWKRDQPAGRMWLLTTPYRGRTCFRVLWGHYATKAEAVRAKATVPDFFVTPENYPAVVALR